MSGPDSEKFLHRVVGDAGSPIGEAVPDDLQKICSGLLLFARFFGLRCDVQAFRINFLIVPALFAVLEHAKHEVFRRHVRRAFWMKVHPLQNPIKRAAFPESDSAAAVCKVRTLAMEFLDTLTEF